MQGKYQGGCMPTNRVLKTTRKKLPKQVWIEDGLKKDFEALVRDYDPEGSMASAIVKLMKEAVKDWYLPGYIRKQRQKMKDVHNQMAEDVIMPVENIKNT
jgi:hypothetical protein